MDVHGGPDALTSRVLVTPDSNVFNSLCGHRDPMTARVCVRRARRVAMSYVALTGLNVDERGARAGPGVWRHIAGPCKRYVRASIAVHRWTATSASTPRIVVMPVVAWFEAGREAVVIIESQHLDYNDTRI